MPPAVVVVELDLPQPVDLNAYRGDSWAQTFTFNRDGTPVDLTGATVACQAMRRLDRTTNTLQTTTGATPGQVTIAMPAAGPLDAGVYTYDVEVTAPGGSVQTWVGGRLKITPDVTNNP
jgi:hypothetical protein